MKLNLKYVGNGTFITKDEVPNLTENALYEVDLKTMDTRSLAQNKLIHAFCNDVSSLLNDSGLYITDVIRYETNWSMQKVKDLIFKPVMKQTYNKNSTTKLEKKELNDIFDSIIKALCSKGIDTSELLNRTH